MREHISIAIETSCRTGGVALGLEDELVAAVDFDASARHTTQLIAQLQRLLSEADFGPEDVNDIYVSAGPGSFTGLRIGITVARTMAQMLGRSRCVAVPTARAIAENAAELDFKQLAVMLAAKRDHVYVAMFGRNDDRQIVETQPGSVLAAEAFLAGAPKPLMLIGEGVKYCLTSAEGITVAPDHLHLPTANGIWQVGRKMSAAGLFTDYNKLLPIYARQPEAVRLWQKRNQKTDSPND